MRLDQSLAGASRDDLERFHHAQIFVSDHVAVLDELAGEILEIRDEGERIAVLAREGKGISPERCIERLAIDFRDLEGVDVDMQSVGMMRQLFIEVVDEGPFFRSAEFHLIGRPVRIE